MFYSQRCGQQSIDWSFTVTFACSYIRNIVLCKVWSHLSVILHNILHHTVASNRYYSRKFWWRFNMAVWWFGTNHWNKQFLILAGHSANFRHAHTSRIWVLVLVEGRQTCIVSKKGIHWGACFWGPNTVYHIRIPILGMKFLLCPNCSSSTVLLSNMMVLNTTFHFTQFHRLKLILVMQDKLRVTWDVYVMCQ